MPVDGSVLRGFDVGRDPYAGGSHRGVDLAAARGSPVRSACAGRVSFAGRVPRGGRTLSVRCGAIVATYQQLGSFAVRAGEVVARGARVATVGTSSDPPQRRPHVHLGARDLATGRYLDPLDLLGSASPALPLAPPATRAPPRAAPLGPAPRATPRPAPARPTPVSPRTAPARPVAAAPSGAPLRTGPVPAAPRSVLVHTGSPGFQPGVPWLAWAGLACFGLGLPIGGFVRLRRRRSATSHYARTA